MKSFLSLSEPFVGLHGKRRNAVLCLTSSADIPVRWRVRHEVDYDLEDQAWLTVEPDEGTLFPGESSDVAFAMTRTLDYPLFDIVTFTGIPALPSCPVPTSGASFPRKEGESEEGLGSLASVEVAEPLTDSRFAASIVVHGCCCDGSAVDSSYCSHCVRAASAGAPGRGLSPRTFSISEPFYLVSSSHIAVPMDTLQHIVSFLSRSEALPFRTLSKSWCAAIAIVHVVPIWPAARKALIANRKAAAERRSAPLAQLVGWFAGRITTGSLYGLLSAPFAVAHMVSSVSHVASSWLWPTSVTSVATGGVSSGLSGALAAASASSKKAGKAADSAVSKAVVRSVGAVAAAKCRRRHKRPRGLVRVGDEGVVIPAAAARNNAPPNSPAPGDVSSRLGCEDGESDGSEYSSGSESGDDTGLPSSPTVPPHGQADRFPSAPVGLHENANQLQPFSTAVTIARTHVLVPNPPSSFSSDEFELINSAGT